MQVTKTAGATVELENQVEVDIVRFAADFTKNNTPITLTTEQNAALDALKAALTYIQNP